VPGIRPEALSRRTLRAHERVVTSVCRELDLSSADARILSVTSRKDVMLGQRHPPDKKGNVPPVEISLAVLVLRRAVSMGLVKSLPRNVGERPSSSSVAGVAYPAVVVSVRGCPSDRQLAISIHDDVLREVREHMTICSDCDYVFKSATALYENRVSTPAVTVRSRIAGAFALLAISMVLVTAAWQVAIGHSTRSRPAPGLTAVAEAYEAQAYRTFDARLDGFGYKPRNRGDGASRPLRMSVSSQVGGSATGSRDAHALRAAGIAYLLDEQWQLAVTSLDETLLNATGTDDIISAIHKSEDGGLLNDVAAAHYELGSRENRTRVLLIGFEAAQRAWDRDRSGEAAWNRALIIETLRLRREAVAAWNDYLTLDPGSDWAVEARSRLARLQYADRSERWPAAKESIRKHVLAGRPELIAPVVAEFPDECRLWIEDGLLRDWAMNIDADAVVARRELTIARAVAPVLERRGNPLFADTLRVIDAAGDPRPLASAHRMYADAKTVFTNSDFARALPLFESAERELEIAQSPYRWLAAMYINSCDYNQSKFKRIFARTDAMLKRTDAWKRYQHVYARVKWVRGVSFVALGRLQEAMSEYDEALRAFESLGELTGMLAIIGLQGSVYDMIGDRDTSWQFRARTLIFADHLGADAPRVQQTYAAFSRDALNERFLATAMLVSDREIESTKANSFAAIHAAALVRRGVLRRQRGRFAEAQRDFAAARDAVQRIATPAEARFVTTQGDYVRASISELEDPAERLAVIDEATRIARESKLHHALVESLLLASRECLQVGDVDRAARLLEEVLTIVEEQRADLSKLVLRDAHLDERREIYRSLVEMELGRGDTARALFFAERGRAATLTEMFASGNPGVTSDARELAAQIPAGTQVVYFVPTETRLLIWVLERSRVRFLSRSVTEAELRKLGRDVFDPNSGDSALASLARELVAPWIGDVADESTLIFVPDDALANVPFAALRDRGEPLIVRHRVGVAPSLRLYLACVARDRALRINVRDASVAAVAVGAARPDLALDALPAAGIEVRAVRRLGEVTVLSGEAAGKRNFLGVLETASLVHFSGHALADGDRPSYSALVLHQESGDLGLLYAYEIEAMRFGRARLVVLASCDSIRNSEKRRNGVSSLGRAFIAAGVPAVIGALKDVDDDVAAELMNVFYARVKAGDDPLQALRRAQLALMDREPVSQWAAFQLIGGIGEMEDSPWLM
jgi:CHAT domain-containing protein/tetratricopeptide (TPR) repeat protein